MRGALTPAALALSQAALDRSPRPRIATAAERKRTRLLLLLGGLLHLTGIWPHRRPALGAFNSQPVQENRNPPTQKQDEPHKTPKKTAPESPQLKSMIPCISQTTHISPHRSPMTSRTTPPRVVTPSKCG